MNIFQSFWRYWKWLCVAMMTTTVVLFLLATAIDYFKASAPSSEIGDCIDSGGTWDESHGGCKAMG